MRRAFVWVLALAVALLLVVQLPAVRGALLTRALAAAADRFDLQVSAETLHYNPFTLAVSVDNVRVAARRTPNLPIFRADRAVVDVSWSILTGGVHIQDITIVRPHVRLVRSTDGRLNLPTLRSSPGGNRPVVIDHLGLKDLTFEFADEPRAIDVTLADASVSLVSPSDAPATFSLRAGTGNRIRIGAWQSPIEGILIDGTLAGRLVRIPYLTVRVGSAAVRVSGTIDAADAGGGYDLRLHAGGPLHPLAADLGAPREVGGSIEFNGALDGPLGEPRVTGTVTSNDFSIDPLAPGSLRAVIEYSRRGLRLQPLEVHAPWGAITAAGTLRAPRDRPNDLQIAWRSLDADVLTAMNVLSPGRTPATIASGSAHARWGGAGGGTVAARGETRLRAVARPGRLPLAGTVRFDVNDDRWVLRPDVLLDAFAVRGSFAGRLAGGPVARTPVSGTAHVSTGSLAGVERLLRAWSYTDAAEALETLDGTAQVTVIVDGRLGAPAIVADATIPEFTFWKLPGHTLRAHAIIDASGQRFDDLELELGGVQLSSDRITRSADGSLAGHVRISSDDPLPWIARFAPRWTGMIAARVNAEGQVSGTFGRPEFTGDVSATDASAAGQQIASVNMRLHVTRDDLEFDELHATQPAGTLEASGRVIFDTGRLDVRGSATDFTVEPCQGPRDPGTCAWTLPLAGRATGTWNMTDLLDAPSGEARLGIANARWAAFDLGQVDADAQFERGRATVAGATPDLGAHTRGTIDLAATGLPFDVNVETSQSGLGTILTRFGLQPAAITIDGPLTMQAHVTGRLTEPRNSSVDATIQPTTLQLRRHPPEDGQTVAVSLDRPVRLLLGPGAIGAEGLSLRLGSSLLTANGLLSAARGSKATAHLDAAAVDIAGAVAALGLARTSDAQGRIVAELGLTGSPSAPDMSASVTMNDAAMTIAGERISAVGAQVDLENGMLVVDYARASWRDTTVDGSGSVPLRWLTSPLSWWPAAWQQAEPPRARAASIVVISASPGALLADRLPRGVPAGGQLAVEVSLAADAPAWESVSGDIRVTNASLTVGNALIAQRGQGRATFMDGRVTVAPWLIQGSGTDLTLQGAVDLRMTQAALDIDIKGPIGLAPLRPLVGFDMAGTLMTALHVTGPAAAPLLDGSLELCSAAMRIETPRLVIADARGAITFDDGVARIDDVTATANGAPVLVRGTYDVAGRVRPDVSVTTAAVPLQVVANGPRLEASVNVQYTADANGPLITGRIAILPQPYRGSILAIQSVITQVQQQYLTRTGGRRPARNRGPAPRLDIALVFEDALVVDSNVGQVELQSDLRVAGTIQDPVLLGTIATLPGGIFRAGGRTYHIERGMVRFENPREIQPVLDLTADTRIGSYDITMTVTGTFDALRTSLRSDPPLAETDLRSLLVTGRLVSDTGGRRDLVDEQRVVESLSSDLFGFAAQAIGLDTVSIGVPDFELIAGGIDASTSLNISKSFSRQVQIIFSQDLQDDTYSWVAIYRPFRSTSFRVLSRETREGAVEVRQEHTFGGGAPPRAPVAPIRQRQPDIRQVLFFGPHGVPDEVLLDQVRLRPGDRFDPWQWQADQDRLYAFYAGRGFRQPRIHATRAATPDGMRLEYEIVQGPRTTLAIDGHSFPRAVTARLDGVWRDALTLDFLIEDLEDIARQHLIDDGYLKPQVRVRAVVDDANTRALLMTVDAGPQTESRETVFTGNRAISSDDLSRAIVAADAARRIWYDPDNAVPIVQAAYRARGYLETSVEAGPIEIAGTRATLPVTITEGRLFRIAKIEFTGAHALSSARLTEATGLHVGDPLNFPAIRAARQKLQALYIERGFGDVEVRSQARVDRPTASLAPLFTIEEGVRRIVADLRIAGNEHTRTKVISDFAQLHRGLPVTPALVSDLQKRLYDMGVFTSVAVDFEPTPIDAGPGVSAPVQPPPGVEHPVTAVVTVDEAARYSMRYGVQFTRTREATGTEVTYGPGAGADFRDRNFLGRAIAAGVGLRYDRRDQSVQGLLGTRRTYGADVRSNLFITGRRERSTTGTDFSVQDNTFSVTAEQRKRLSTSLELAWAFAYDYRRLAVRHVQDDQLALAFTGDTVGPRLALAWDSRDNPFDATRGWFHSSAIDFGVRPLGSDLSYARYLLQHFQFVPIGKVVLASAVRFGTLDAYGDQDNLHPVSFDLLFTAGGSHSVRGYAEDSLGPPAIANLRLGNRHLLVLNQEVRFPLYRWFKGAAFIDAGNTFPRLSDLSLGDLRVGAGAGLRLATPVGLFRMDVAWPIDSRPEDTTRVYFSIGQAF